MSTRSRAISLRMATCAAHRTTASMLAALVFALSLTGCSTAPRHEIETEVRGPAWGGSPFTDLLLIAAYDDRALRVSSETIAADRLSEAAVGASPSFDRIPDLSSLDDATAIRRALEGTTYDAIVTIATVEAGADFDGAAYEAQYSLVRLLGSEGSFTRIGGALDYYESGRYVLDIGVWDARTLEPVWHATTDSYSLEDTTQQARDTADFLVRVLRERGFIR